MIPGIVKALVCLAGMPTATRDSMGKTTLSEERPFSVYPPTHTTRLASQSPSRLVTNSFFFLFFLMNSFGLFLDCLFCLSGVPAYFGFE